MEEPTSPTLGHLEDQITWYDRESRDARRMFKLLKLIQIVAAALIPLVTVFSRFEQHSAQITSVLGLIILIVEGIQQLNQYQTNWISYRSTCEALKHEKYLFLGKAGPYAGAADPTPLLADRIEGLISQEHAKWVSVQEQSMRTGEGRQAEARSTQQGDKTT